MKKNMGWIDRGIRVIVAAGAISGSGVLGFSSAGGIVLLVAAAVMAVTAASGYCPVYQLLGVKTTGVKTTGVKTTGDGGAEDGGHDGFRLHRAA